MVEDNPHGNTRETGREVCGGSYRRNVFEEKVAGQ